jgi:hypothetical protein
MTDILADTEKSKDLSRLLDIHSGFRFANLNPWFIFTHRYGFISEIIVLQNTRVQVANLNPQRGDKGVCKFVVTHPRPLFLEGSLKGAAKGSLIQGNDNDRYPCGY